MDMLSFLFLPFVAGFVLTGIHAYLGIHVVERGVIFVDLSLAQIAASIARPGFRKRRSSASSMPSRPLLPFWS